MQAEKDYEAAKAAWAQMRDSEEQPAAVVSGAPADEMEAVALAAAINEDKAHWSGSGKYKVAVNGQEFLVDLSKEIKDFR